MNFSLVVTVAPSGTVMSETNAARSQLTSSVADGVGVIVGVNVGVLLGVTVGVLDGVTVGV